jgi:hypothetical protein
MQFREVWADIRRYGLSAAALKILLAITGFIVWTGFSVWAGLANAGAFHLREAWASSAYFYVGAPLMAMAVGLAAFHFPQRAWRWPVSLVAGHQVGILLVGVGMQSRLSLLILTVIMAILLAAFFTIPALVGSTVARHLSARAF